MNVSPRGVAEPLRAAGHDVLALLEDRSLWETADEVIIEMAIDAGRVIVTFDVSDFVRLLAACSREPRGHPGAILISTKTFHSDEFGRLTEGILAALEQIGESDAAWHNRLHWLRRADR